VGYGWCEKGRGGCVGGVGWGGGGGGGGGGGPVPRSMRDPNLICYLVGDQ